MGEPVSLLSLARESQKVEQEEPTIGQILAMERVRNGMSFTYWKGVERRSEDHRKFMEVERIKWWGR